MSPGKGLLSFSSTFRSQSQATARRRMDAGMDLKIRQHRTTTAAKATILVSFVQFV
jgi:hypothetical protein